VKVKRAAVFIEIENEDGSRTEAYVPNALITAAQDEDGTTSLQIITTGAYQITKHNKHIKRKHIKETA